MALALVTAPATEPLDLTTVKRHLRLDSGTPSDNITTVQSIVPGSHAIAASYTLVGTGVDVLGYDVIVNLNAGTNGASGTVDVKIQESDDDITYTDWTGGAFTQVTEDNDNAVQEKAYTGTKQYIRVVATVTEVACEFGVDILKIQPYSTEDTLLEAAITEAREDAETFQNRAYITQTWELWLDDFPTKDYIKLPRPPLQSVTSIKYYGTDDTEYTMSTDDYFVDTKSEPGGVALGYSKTWPTTTLRPTNAVVVRFVAGYGAAADVPEMAKRAMILRLKLGYDDYSPDERTEIEKAFRRLLWRERITPL